MADRLESEDETKQLRSTLLETATSILQIRQRAEQEIRQTNEVLEQRTRELGHALMVLRATLDSTTDAILVTDEKFNLTEFNEKYIDMWKVPRQVLESGMLREVQELTSQNFADSEGFIARIEQIVSSERESFDPLELKDGRILERYSKVLTIDGQRAGRVWSFRDVTERHLAEITSHRLAAIVASSDDAIIGKDLNSIITSWNFGAERIFGYTADEMIGTSIIRLIPPDRQEEEQEILSRIRRGERFDHFETIRLGKDGRRLNLSITVSPIKDSNGHVVGASKVARDITERKRAEEEAEMANRERLRLLESEREARTQLERANRIKDEFLATLSHELRTPLNAVLGWAKILRLGKLQGEELRQGLDTIERNAGVQAQLIEDLLDMSRIISGKVRLDVEMIDLPAVLNESIETLRATAEAKGVRLKALGIPFPYRSQAIQIAFSRFSGTSFTMPLNSLPRTERSTCGLNASTHTWKSASLIPVKASQQIFCLMFSNGFNRQMRRQLVDMAGWDSDWLLSSSWSNCMAATSASKAAGSGKGRPLLSASRSSPSILIRTRNAIPGLLSAKTSLCQKYPSPMFTCWWLTMNSTRALS